MGSLFKKTRTDYILNGKNVNKETPGAKAVKRESKEWYGGFEDENGKKKQKKLSRDKTVARTMLSNLEKEIERKKAGLVDNFMEEARKPLSEHLSDYLAYLRDKGNTTDHVAVEKARIERIMAGCSFNRIGDFNANRLFSWLASQQKKLDNFGVVTRNHHLRAIKGFAKWLVDHHRIQSNPFASLKRINPDTEARHPRRVLSDQEFTRLIEATEKSSRVDQGRDWKFTPKDRSILYQVAAFTGLRAKELASLRVRQFDLDDLCITLGAIDSKHRKTDHLPIQMQLAPLLASWFEEKGFNQDDFLWKGNWAKNKMGAKLVKRDLKEAGIEFETYSGVFDFHCLRGQFGTMLARAEIHPKIAQDLMRHSDINLTMKYYTKLSLSELSEPINKLQLPKINQQGEDESQSKAS